LSQQGKKLLKSHMYVVAFLSCACHTTLKHYTASTFCHKSLTYWQWLFIVLAIYE
jgi:hypothetical protein